MQRNEFLTDVQDRAGLDTVAAAGTATDAVLTTLGRRIAPEEADNLAAQLPDSLAESVRSLAEEDPEAFGRDGFVDRVATKPDVDEGTAGDYLDAVGETLARAVSESELEDVRTRLPDDLSEPLRAPRSGDAPR